MGNVLIAGCGYVGTALGLRLAASGHRVFGLRRQSQRLPSPIHRIGADLTRPETLRNLPSGIDAVIYTASADETSDEAYRAAYVDGPRHLLEVLRHNDEHPRRFLFTSSTAVYAQDDGQWVDEHSPTDPRHFAGRRLLEAEEIVLAGPFPAVVVRLAGIYGPGRAGLVELVRAGKAPAGDDDVYTNRIHRDDSAGLLAHLLTLAEVERIYIGADDEPVTVRVLVSWLAERLGAAVRGGPTPAGRHRPRTNKRCRNRRLRASGYVLSYPTFRDGYAALIESGSSGTVLDSTGALASTLTPG